MGRWERSSAQPLVDGASRAPGPWFTKHMYRFVSPKALAVFLFYFISQISFTLSLKAPLSKIVLISSIEPVVLQPVGQLLSYFPVKRCMGIYCYAPGLEDPCPALQQTDQGKASRESLQLAFIADKPEICTGRNFCALSFCLKIIRCITKTTLEECCLKTYLHPH